MNEAKIDLEQLKQENRLVFKRLRASLGQFGDPDEPAEQLLRQGSFVPEEPVTKYVTEYVAGSEAA